MSAGSQMRTFLDSNVLLYTDDQANPGKQKRAIQILTELRQLRSGVISLQVLQEYFVIATRKYGVGHDDARQKIELFAAFEVVEPGLGDVFAAIDLHRLRRLSYWDALIVQTAKRAGCPILFSEDMQHGQIIDGIRIVNPFI
jgi:predicted nucleic acid-binding protein